MRTHRLVLTASLVAGSLLSPFASHAFAQARPTAAQADARWDAWVGCWEMTSELGVDRGDAPIVCVRPAGSGSAVELATVSGGAVVRRDTLDASGTPRESVAQSCTATTRADWSRDARRVYVRSETLCPGAPARIAHRIIALSSVREWLDVESTESDGMAGTRTVRYRELIGRTLRVPAEFVSLVDVPVPSRNAARQIAGSDVALDDVMEATARVDSLTVQAWVLARGQRFDVGARDLVRLADARVPGAVTDALIAVSYPHRFAVVSDAPEMVPARRTGGVGGGADYGLPMYATDPCDIALTPYALRYGYDSCRSGFYGCAFATPFAYDVSYGCGGRSRYGYGYGYDYGIPGPIYTGSFRRPVIIVKDPELPHGKLVNGRGYTRETGRGSNDRSTADPFASGRTGDSGGGGSVPRQSGSTQQTTTRSTESTGSGSSGSGSSGASGSTGRTAVRRGGG